MRCSSGSIGGRPDENRIPSHCGNRNRRAVSYYNGQSEELGYEFAAEVRQTMARIVAFPEAWQRVSARTRRCRTKRFPYGVLYQVRVDMILIVAVMHLRRHPDTWKSRLDPSQR